MTIQQNSPTGFDAKLGNLPPGKYYLSLGRVLSETEIQIDGTRVNEGALTLGAPLAIERKLDFHQLTIRWAPTEKWRDKLYDLPILSRYGVGVVIQAWRGFNGICLGPVFSLLLLISAIAYSRISKAFAARILPHFVMAAVGLLYTVYLADIPDLFCGYEFNTVVQLLLRVGFSAAVLYLLGTYSKMPRCLLWLHVLCAAQVILVAILRPEWLITTYRFQMALFGIFLFLAARTLYIFARGHHAELLFHLTSVWVLLHAFAVFMYWASGASFLTVWTPSFVAVLACVEFYLIYCEAVDLAAQSESARRAIQLARQVAHDIRSPLAALRIVVSGSTSLDTDERVLAELAFGRIDRIAQDILAEHRRIKDSHEIQSALVVPLVAKIVKEKELEFSGSPRITLDSSHVFDAPVKFEPRQLERVLSNLLNNARDVSRESQIIEVSIRSSDGYTMISVRDHGFGIPSEVLRSIRGNRIESTKSSGNGLGLSHALSCVTSWGGRIDFESKEGTGTEVTLFLQKSKN